MFTDQFGNRRKVKSRFKPPRKAVVAPAPERERLSSITDPIEKQVASVLQSELGRYRTNGRREGGLGSVDATYQGNRVQLGGDFREPGTARNQIIVPDPEKVTIASDNADALERLYESLVDDDERERFKRSILSRVGRDSAYAPIAYLPLMVALELDFAPSVFETARANLLGDKGYGFSNCLMLLDGLLRLRHENLPVELLDDVEDFIEGTGEHPFAIPERIAAIRAHRLAANSGHS